MVLRERPLCEECEKHGRVCVATEVHHRWALRAGGKRLDRRNLRSLCRECHTRARAEEERGSEA